MGGFQCNTRPTSSPFSLNLQSGWTWHGMRAAPLGKMTRGSAPSILLRVSTFLDPAAACSPSSLARVSNRKRRYPLKQRCLHFSCPFLCNGLAVISGSIRHAPSNMPPDPEREVESSEHFQGKEPIRPLGTMFGARSEPAPNDNVSRHPVHFSFKNRTENFVDKMRLSTIIANWRLTGCVWIS